MSTRNGDVDPGLVVDPNIVALDVELTDLLMDSNVDC